MVCIKLLADIMYNTHRWPIQFIEADSSPSEWYTLLITACWGLELYWNYPKLLYQLQDFEVSM